MKRTMILSRITMFIAVVLILTGYSMIFINDYRVDAKEMSSSASLIKSSYISYKVDIEEVSYDIKDTDIFNIKYYTELKLNYDSNLNELVNIENKIKDIETRTESILYECSTKNYNDYEIEHNCEMISYNNESLINAYVSLVGKYNSMINDYNTWLEKQKNITITKLDEYIPTYYNETIDLNNDGELSGIIK